MTRATWCFVALAICAGCRGSGSLPPVDPFGRTTIEPPRTGAIRVQPPNAVAPGTMPPGGATGSATPSASSAVPPVAPAAGGHAPQGGFDVNSDPSGQPRPLADARPGDRIAIPIDARDLSKQSTTVELAGSTGLPISAGPERITRTIEPRPSEPVATTGGVRTGLAPDPPQREPARLPNDGEVIGIMDLPAAGAANRQPSPAAPFGVQLASAIEPLDSAGILKTSQASPGQRTAPFSPSARYGFAPDYVWLRGRLEYSQIDRRWKLRYIPIDGETDDFGGSVLIADDAVLSGYERGEFVEVHGHIDATATDDRHFAPQYAVRQIKRIAN